MIVKFICATITRSLFILVSLMGVWRVTHVKNDKLYWLLTILSLLLVVEMIITLKRRNGSGYKWFSPAIVLFLLSIIPTIWILEFHHQHHKSEEKKCGHLDSPESIEKMMNDWKNSSNQNSSNTTQMQMLPSVCANDWILALHQMMLILLIVGKWLLPSGVGVTRDQLSQLLLVFVGIAADILEFTSETLSDLKQSSPHMVYIILAVWTWSMLQFPLNLSVMTSDPEGYAAPENSILSRHGADIWQVVESLFIMDGPFLVVRLTVMFHFGIVHQMLIFFTIKNFLVVILNFYRLHIICQDYKSSM
ncbi:transmembrane protein 26 [Clupea harengus]|uniref:Transmembrane protein 26 n=1 Tax=Clupea harengus TaxID=7950 RepID=A0A6P8EXT2_CLUHA|nr:transmembrane protein 26 [Clupea harengus]